MLLASFAFTAHAQTQPGNEPTVTAIELHLPAGMTAEDLPDKVTLRRGQPLSRRAVRDSIDRLWATNLFADVVVRTFREAGGVRVVFEFAGRRCIALIGAEDNSKLSDEEIIKASGLAARATGEGGPAGRKATASECPEAAEYYPERLRAAVEGIRAAYRDRGYDEADVRVKLFEESRGIVTVFQVTEGLPTRVAGVTVAGAPGFPLSKVLSESGLEVGAILDKALLVSVRERLKEALRRERFYRARLGEPVVQREGNLATLSIPVEAGPRYAIHFHGNRTFSDKQLLAVLEYSGQDPIDATLMSRLQRRVGTFYRDRGFFDATVTVREVVRPDGAEAVLAVDIEEGAPLFVERIEFSGNKAVSSEDMRDIVIGHVRAQTPVLSAEVGQVDDPLGLEGRVDSSNVASAVLEPENIYSEEAYHNAANALTELYRDRGYLGANVRLASVQIGATQTLRFRQHTSVVSDLHRASVHFVVEEGAQTIIRELTVAGNPAGFDGTRLIAGLLQTGTPLNASRVEQGQTRLTRELNSAGYLFANVQHEVATTDDDQVGHVLYKLYPGPQVRVGAIPRPIGLARTEEQLVRANLAIAPGELLDPEKLFETQRKLVLTGAFRQVTVRVVDPDVPAETKDVEISVRESAQFSGEISGGFSFSEGPRFGIDASAPNFFGSGINVSARGRLNYVGASALTLFPQCVTVAPRDENASFVRPSQLVPSTTAQCIEPDEYLGLEGLGGRGNISLHQPQIFALSPALVGARADIVAERVHRPLYRFTRFAGIVGVDWSALEFASWNNLSGGLSTSLQYELEHDRVVITPNLGRADPVSRLNERFPDGYYTLQNVRGVLNAHYRDDPTNPQWGAVLTLSTEFTDGIAATQDDPLAPEGTEAKEVTLPGFDLLTLKTSGNLTFYVPLLPRKSSRDRNLVFAGSLRFGQLFKLNDGTEPVLPKRFFMGGISTMRGFREDGLIPADRRESLRTEVADCRALVSQLGCTSEAATILAGQEPLSSGGKQYALAKAELRIPTFTSLDLGVFFEAGNLWYEPRELLSLRLEDFRYVAGAGLRYTTPIGPLAFDFGFNLFPDRVVNEEVFSFHFSIGLF